MGTTYCSRANMKQRQGRAGRTRHGYCYKLVTRQVHDMLNEHQVPELLRLPLDEIILQVLSPLF